VGVVRSALAAHDSVNGRRLPDFPNPNFPIDSKQPLGINKPYLNTQGYRVGCKDEVLQVKEKDRIIEEVRMRDLSHVALFGNIQISTQAIQALCEQEVPVTYFSMGGWFYGITRGHALERVSAHGTVPPGA